MKENSQGWETVADGTCTWVLGLSAQERKVEIRKHGKLVSFEATK